MCIRDRLPRCQWKLSPHLQRPFPPLNRRWCQRPFPRCQWKLDPVCRRRRIRRWTQLIRQMSSIGFASVISPSVKTTTTRWKRRLSRVISPNNRLHCTVPSQLETSCIWNHIWGGITFEIEPQTNVWSVYSHAACTADASIFCFWKSLIKTPPELISTMKLNIDFELQT